MGSDVSKEVTVPAAAAEDILSAGADGSVVFSNSALSVLPLAVVISESVNKYCTFNARDIKQAK